MSDAVQILICGGGGFAREVAWLLSSYERAGTHRLLGYLDPHHSGDGALNAKPVYRRWSEVPVPPSEALVSVAVGAPDLRERLVGECAAMGYGFATLAHHSVEISEYVSVGSGSIICCGSILTVNISVGAHVHINLDCTVGHDAVIEDFVTLSPGVHVSGNVRIERGAYIGTGASIINGTHDDPLVIGRHSVVAAGACVTRSADPNSLYAGVPAVHKKSYGVRTADA